MSGLRVAMVSPYGIDRPGGVQGQALGLAAALRRRGHEVAVLAPADRWDRAGGRRPDPPGAAAPGAPWGTVVVGRATGVPANGSVAPVCLSPAASHRVRRFAAAHRLDVVHLHEPMAPVLGYACLARPPGPMVATFHRSGDSPWYRALRPLGSALARGIDVRVAVSASAAATARRALGGRYEVLFNGVDVQRFTEAPPAPTGGRPTVLFVGRHEPRKGLAVLLEAFASVGGPAQLWVSGTGGQTAELRRRYPPSERVHWLGALPDDELASRLAGADVLCAPALGGESFGMVVLEGLAARCAVVASDIDGYREGAGGCAVLVPPGDAGALSSALTEVLAGWERRSGALSDERLEAGLARARRWSLDALAGEYEARYERALERHRPP